MEALMLSLMLAISTHTGLPMPAAPMSIGYAPMAFEADPLVRYDGLNNAIIVDIKWDETNVEHRALLAQTLADVMRQTATAAASRQQYGEPARDVATAGGAR
jgi:hypothetical protein